MSADPLVLDPEFEQLLREIAADPDSTLLRVPRPKVVRGFFERDEALSANATVLTRAEKHLVRTRGNELAWLLRQACLYKLVEGPTSKSYVSRYGPSGKDCSPLDQALVRERVEWEREEASGSDQHEHAVELLLRCVKSPVGGEPHVAELAMASHRLQPTNAARLQVAIDLCLRDAPRAGLSLAWRVLNAHPLRDDATRAWECIGLAYSRLGRLKEVHLAYQKGCAGDDPHTYVNRLVFALQVGDRRDAIDCARQLNDMLPGDPPAMAWYVEAIRGRRQAREWSPTRAGRELAQSLADQLDGVARRVSDVLV